MRWYALASIVAIACGCDGTADSSTADVASSIEDDRHALLTASNDAELRAAADRLVSHGAKAEAEMARVLAETDDAETKQRMINGLAAARAYDSVPAILAALDDASSGVRATANKALTALLHIRVRYDADAPESERAEAIRRYRDHWDRLNKTGLIEFQKNPEMAERKFRESTTFSRPKNEVGNSQ